MTSGIYCYIDLKTDTVVYVGRDSQIHKKTRHKQHISPYGYQKQQINRILQNNPNRYKYYVLEEGNFTNDELNTLEQNYIKKYNTFKDKNKFNYTKGGDGCLGMCCSEETKRKISKANKGKCRSEAVKKRMSKMYKGEKNPMYGKTHSEEVKKKISQIHKGKTIPKEIRKKISMSLKGREFSEEHRKKLSECQMGEKNHMYGKHHSEESVIRLAKSLNNTSGYLRVSKKKGKTYSQGFTWQYRYYENGKRKAISATNLIKLEQKVKEKGLLWRKIDEVK